MAGISKKRRVEKMFFENFKQMKDKAVVWYKCGDFWTLNKLMVTYYTTHLVHREFEIGVYESMHIPAKFREQILRHTDQEKRRCRRFLNFLIYNGLTLKAFDTDAIYYLEMFRLPFISDHFFVMSTIAVSNEWAKNGYKFINVYVRYTTLKEFITRQLKHFPEINTNCDLERIKTELEKYKPKLDFSVFDYIDEALGYINKNVDFNKESDTLNYYLWKITNLNKYILMEKEA